MDLELTGQTVVVTGGASGIGRACAEGFLAEGAKVAVWDADSETAAVATRLQPSAPDRPAALGVRVDVTRREELLAAAARTRSELGPIDHLVHAAAIGSGQFGFPFTNVDPDSWRRVLEVNLLGLVETCHVLADELISQRRGTITVLSSVAGQIGSQTDPPYSASKAAAINFAQCLARDLAPSQVRVNTVCPGMVQTPLNRGVWKSWHDRQPPERRMDYESWAAEKIEKLIPLNRWQQPADIADMVVFLASARASQVTGQTINVDGGYVMHW